MRDFWTFLVKPLLESVMPREILWVGPGDSETADRLLQFCRDNRRALHIVASPSMGLDRAWGDADDALLWHDSLEGSVLGDLPSCDVALVEGEPNWAWITDSLASLEGLSALHDAAFPITFVSRTGWPYGRRDRYSESQAPGPAPRRPAVRGGVLPRSLAVVPGQGLAPGVLHARYEHTFQNGVLTAVEDFVRSRELRLLLVPGFHGLAVLAPPEATRTHAFVHRLFDNAGAVLLESGYIEALEAARVSELAALSTSRGATSLGVRGSNTGLEMRRLRQQLETSRAEVRRLTALLLRVRSEVLDLLESRRWRLGNLLGGLFNRLRRRPQTPTGADHLRSLFDEAAGVVAGSPSDARPPDTDGGEPDDKPSFYHQVLRRIEADAGEALARQAVAATEAWLRAQRPSASSGPLVSIVMPTRNRALVIEEAIQTVREQRYRRWELLVCDDGGSDDTEERVRRLRDHRISYFRIEPAGAAAARNRALERARGDLIAYLDSDNLWHPSYLATLVAVLEKGRAHRIVYCGSLDVVVDSGEYRLRACNSRPFDYEALTQANYIDLNTVVHRRELFEEMGGFDERLERLQDWDLLLQYAARYEPLFVDALLVIYRRNRAWNPITYEAPASSAWRRVRRKSAERRGKRDR